MIFIDVQGTLIDDKYRKPIVGAIEFIDFLNENRIPYIIITNNTKFHSSEFLKYLNSVGFKIDKEHYIDPLMVLKEILKEKKVAVYGIKNFLNVIKDLGYDFDYKNPEAVLISVKKDYNFEDFAKIIEFLLNGAKLYGMHATSLYVKESKRYPGVGAILEMLKFATGKDYEVVGKPSVNFYNRALEKIKKLTQKDINFKDITIISDDAKGDLAGAKKLGMKTILVLSGKIKSENELNLKKDEMPDLIFENIGKIEVKKIWI